MPANLKSRGHASNRPGRFATTHVVPDEAAGPTDAAPATAVTAEQARSIVSTNRSPDVPFERSINPYRGCEHGCVYCYARPSHSYLDLSPGLDFETKIFAKDNADELLRRYLERPGYACKPITLGANTDPYQPAEKDRRLTRRLLATMHEYGQPAAIITKGALVTRDCDILTAMAQRNLCRVAVSVPTAKAELKRTLEPRVPSAAARFRAIETLTALDIPVTLMLAPVIPGLTDDELESLLARGAAAGADSARYILLRLPHEVAPLFRQWLDTAQPLRARHVMSLVNQLSGGRDYDATFGRRQRGRGPFARLLAARFDKACARLSLHTGPAAPLDCGRFRPPGAVEQQRLPF